MPCVLPSCLFGAYEVCSVLCVHAFCFSSFAFSFFVWEVISGAGAVREDVGTSLQAHSIRCVTTSTVFF